MNYTITQKSNDKSLLLSGKLYNIHPSAQQKDILIPEAQWFQPNPMDINKSYIDVYKNYKFWLERGKRQGYFSRTNFSFNKMKEKIEIILNDNVKVPTQVSLNLPKLKKLNLPKLKKL